MPRTAWAADPYDSLASALTTDVLRSGTTSVEIMPFVDTRGRLLPLGRMLSGRLLSRIAAQKRLQVVIGAMPDTIIEPYTAALGDLEARALRARLAPRTWVAGSVVVLGAYSVVRDRIKLNVQAIEVSTGKVLYAGDADTRNEWDAAADFLSPPAPTPLRIDPMPTSALAKAGVFFIGASTNSPIPPNPLDDLLKLDASKP